MNRTELLNEAILRWGKESQSFMAIEEMAELTKALSKAYRKFGTEQIVNILEEIADVRIMLDQLQIMFEPLANNGDMTYLVSLAEEGKLARLAQRLGVEYTPNTDFNLTPPTESQVKQMLGRRTAAYRLRQYADNPRKEKEDGNQVFIRTKKMQL
jgi:hypothetical protein